MNGQGVGAQGEGKNLGTWGIGGEIGGLVGMCQVGDGAEGWKVKRYGWRAAEPEAGKAVRRNPRALTLLLHLAATRPCAPHL